MTGFSARKAFDWRSEVLCIHATQDEDNRLIGSFLSVSFPDDLTKFWREFSLKIKKNIRWCDGVEEQKTTVFMDLAASIHQRTEARRIFEGDLGQPHPLWGSNQTPVGWSQASPQRIISLEPWCSYLQRLISTVWKQEILDPSTETSRGAWLEICTASSYDNSWKITIVACLYAHRTAQWEGVHVTSIFGSCTIRKRRKGGHRQHRQSNAPCVRIQVGFTEGHWKFSSNFCLECFLR